MSKAVQLSILQVCKTGVGMLREELKPRRIGEAVGHKGSVGAVDCSFWPRLRSSSSMFWEGHSRST